MVSRVAQVRMGDGSGLLGSGWVLFNGVLMDLLGAFVPKAILRHPPVRNKRFAYHVRGIAQLKDHLFIDIPERAISTTMELPRDRRSIMLVR